MVDDNRAIFMFRDGSQAWEAKNFLIEQERCESVTVENKVYPGKYSTSTQVITFANNAQIWNVEMRNEFTKFRLLL